MHSAAFNIHSFHSEQCCMPCHDSTAVTVPPDMKQHRARTGKFSTPADCKDGDWMLQKANAIKSFLAQQRGRTQQSSSKTAWLVAWEQLAAEGELAGKQLQQALQPSSTSCADLQQDVAELAALHERLQADTQEQQLQLLGQAQDLSSLVKRAIYMGTTDLLPAEAAALASLLQELHWLQQDTQQQNSQLAGIAQGWVCELAAAVPGCTGASAWMLDGAMARRASSDVAAAAATATVPTGSSTSAKAAAAAHSTSAARQHSSGGTIVGASLTDSTIADDGEAGTDGAAAAAAAGCAGSDLQQLLVQHPLAPLALQQQLQQAYSDLQQQHQQQMQDTSAQQRLHSGQCEGWTPDQHALFIWFRTQALQGLTGCIAGSAHTAAAAAGSIGSSKGVNSSVRGAAGFRPHNTGCHGSGTRSISSIRGVGGTAPKGSTKASVVDYLAVRMPGKTKQQLDAHESWYTTALQLQRRVEDLQDTWQHQRAAFLQSAEASLATAAAATAAAAESAAVRLTAAVSRQLLHEQLEGIQQIKQQQQEQQAAAVAAVAAVQAAQAAAEAAARRERCAEQRVLVQTYKQQIAKQQQEAERAAHEARISAAEAATAAVEASKPAVAARQAEALQRLQQQQEQQRQRAADAELRQQRLAAIAAAMGPKLDRDPDRVLQATAASAAAAPAVGQAFKPVHGFTAQQVTADPRFRLIEALREAGVLRGGAGSAGYLKLAMARVQGP